MLNIEAGELLPLQFGPAASEGLSNTHVSDVASTVSSSLHLTGGAQVSWTLQQGVTLLKIQCSSL